MDVLPLDTPGTVRDTYAPRRHRDGTGVGIDLAHIWHTRRRTKYADAFSGEALPARALCYVRVIHSSTGENGKGAVIHESKPRTWGGKRNSKREAGKSARPHGGDS